MIKNSIWAIQASLFFTLTLITSLLPAIAARQLGNLAGFLIGAIIPKRRAIARENISRALPFLTAHPLWNRTCQAEDELVRETFQNIGRSLVEVCQLYHGQGSSIISTIELRGREHLDAARAKNKGLILLTGHCGNWELLALALGSLFGEEVSGVARRQNNPYLNRMAERMRLQYNSHIIYKHNALRNILSALKKRRIVGILADQAVMPEEGCLIEVMGRNAWVSKAPVVISQRSGAPLVPVFIHHEQGRHIITFYPEYHLSGDMSEGGIRTDTQALSGYIEDFVATHPTQWYWVHRRWKRA